MTEVPDYSGYKNPEDNQIGHNLMSALVDFADQHEACLSLIERLEEQLKEAKDNLKRIDEVEIPTLLDGIQGKINLPDGRIIEVSEKIRGNIGGDKKLPALNWLNKNGHGNLIKRKFVIEFNRDEEEKAKEFEKELREAAEEFNFKTELGVHWQTLDAFIRERLAEGDDIPLDTFGVYRQKITKVK